MPQVQRLINTFRPKHYELSLRLLRKEREFSGKVTITGTSVKNADKIILHSKDLVITSCLVDGQRTEAGPANDNDEVTLKLPNGQQAGEHQVILEFQGKITDAMHGIYPSVFEHDGVKKELLATQFESHHAREAFPCIDEPEAKATFNVTLETENDIVALGNMPIKNQQVADGNLITVFEQTPRMSTYLLAFTVGELQEKTKTTKNGTEVRIWATPAQSSESLDFALDTAVRCIDFFNDYFGVPYPLPKSDHVALPDFSSGAMENWGLITYREVCLLVDPKDTSVAAKEFVALVICHELSHQWFGNLVTMKWWDDLWLNESFACLMEYVAVDALFPEWDIWTTFASQEALGSMRRDSLPGVQPVKTDVTHPDEIATLFDPAIVYAKGARLLFMLYRYIGEEAFTKGLRQYFHKHAYSNTEGHDLWEAFSQSSGKAVAAFMEPWLEKPGFPLIRIVDDKDGKYTVGQAAFNDIKDTAALWPVPLFTDDSSLSGTILDKLSISLESSNTPLWLNSNAAGYYSVRYETPEHAAAIASKVSGGSMPASNRLLLLNDSLLQARSGISGLVDTMRLLDHYIDESEEPVWSMISLIIADARKIIETDKEAEKLFKLYVRKLIDTQYQRLGWVNKETESMSDTKLRSIILGLGLYSEDQKIISKALELYDDSGLSNLPTEIRGNILAAVVKYGENKYREKLLEAYKNTQKAELKQDIASGLTSTRDEKHAAQLLDLITDASVVRLQDADRWFIGLLQNRYARQLAWEWMKKNWSWIEKNFSSDKSYEHYPRYAALIFSSKQELESFREFFTPLADQPSLKRTIKIGLNDISARVEWRDRDIGPMKQFLQDSSASRFK